MAAGGVLKSKGQIAFGANICLCNKSLHPGLVDKKLVKPSASILVYHRSYHQPIFYSDPRQPLLVRFEFVPCTAGVSGDQGSHPARLPSSHRPPNTTLTLINHARFG